MPGGPDLFVICKSCGAEVSPYITECPYCGARLRKRAPKIDRPGVPPPRRRRLPRVPRPGGAPSARRRPARRGRPTGPPGRAPHRARRPSLGRLRPGEIPGVRLEARPYATIALVLIPIVATLAYRAGAFSLLDAAIVGPPDGEWWRLITALGVYANMGCEFAALVATALFGWLLERRHGPAVPILAGLGGGVAGMMIAVAIEADPTAVGGQAIALALLGAWVAPELLALRGGRRVESDLLGVAVIAAVLLLIPLAAPEVNEIAGVGGALVGLILGPIFPALDRRGR